MKNPLDKIISWYFTKNTLPYWCVLIADSLFVFLSGIFTFWTFRKTAVLFDFRFAVLYTMLIYTAFAIIGFRVFRTYSGIVRYSSFVDLMRVGYGSLLSMVIALIYSVIAEKYVCCIAILSQTETVVTFCVATLLMWAGRVMVKNLYDVMVSDKRAMRVLIYGALSGGIGLAKNINSQNPKKFLLQGFISHDKQAKHMLLMGKQVYNVNDNLEDIIAQKHIDAVLVSPLRIDDFRNNQQIQDMLIKVGCKIYMTQQAKEINPNEDELSIGSEMVRQVAVYKPAKMMLIDQAETPEHDIRLMMEKEFPDVKAETVVTSICKEDRMEQIFRDFKPDYVFHAAAYKHVPMMENNPSEAVQNNIYGTKVIADLSVKYGVKKFVMVSTDKAVNPTNVMGCSKRICEIYVQSLGKTTDKTQFITTRFGNVLGSNGSVIPLFREQIKNGGPVTVTDPRIVRFFMLIPEACKLVLEAGTKGHGGEIFVFDMGQPVKIADLAQRMIALSGAKGVKIEYTGLRAGEKLYEEVLNELEGTKPSFHKKIRIAEVREYDYDEVSKEINELIATSKQYDDMATVKKMKEIVPEYKSNNSVYEVLDK